MNDDECYVVTFCNDGDYDHYEEWVDRIFADPDDAYNYLIGIGFRLVCEETLYFKRRFPPGTPERWYDECSRENGGQSAWIDRKPYYGR